VSEPRAWRRIGSVVARAAAFCATQLVAGRGRDPLGPVRLRRHLEALGGAYIKFGQLLSLQADILSRPWRDALFDLLDRVPPFPFDEVERTFREDFGVAPLEAFDAIDREPVASASIAQVHAAWLGGRKLAVKVRRPDAPARYEADLRFLARVRAAILALRLRRLRWVARLIDELALWTREELDFEQEARYQRALAHHARSSSTERVPAVVDRLTGPRVLTAEFLEGPTMLRYIRGLDGLAPPLDAAELAHLGFEPHAFARNVVDNFVGDAFEHGLFHADLHPANLVLQPGNVVGYVDFGITGALSRFTRRNIVAMILALLHADAESLAHHFEEVSTREPDADSARFRRELDAAVERWFEPAANGDGQRRLRTSFTRLMIDMLRVSRQTGLIPTADSVRYMRSVISTEGLIRRFAPDFDIARHLERTCAGFLEDEVIRQWMTVERLADWSVTMASLVRRSPGILVRLANRLADAERETRAGRTGDG